eukprot:PLAT6813.4.p1 GENE.PLAT6813.4~~PLAT6813.4.p1  ORF type:complete len:314 (+),score=126.55 PLAT6813.4:64-942(+)
MAEEETAAHVGKEEEEAAEGVGTVDSKEEGDADDMLENLFGDAGDDSDDDEDEDAATLFAEQPGEEEEEDEDDEPPPMRRKRSASADRPGRSKRARLTDDGGDVSSDEEGGAVAYRPEEEKDEVKEALDELKATYARSRRKNRLTDEEKAMVVEVRCPCGAALAARACATPSTQRAPAQDFLLAMDNAAEADIRAYNAGEPALNKLGMLDKVRLKLAGLDLQHLFLDKDLLGVFNRWLQPMADGALPNLRVRTALIELSSRLPVEKQHLRRSGLGKTLCSCGVTSRSRMTTR